MASNTDALKDAYKAFSEGDADSAADAFADDAVWEGSNSTELPGGGNHEGKEAIVEAMKSVAGGWDEYKLTPDEFFENEDTVVVLLHADVKGAESGQLPTVHIARFEDGKIRRFQALTDTLLSAQYLGLIGGKPPEDPDSDDDDSEDNGSDNDEKDSEDRES